MIEFLYRLNRCLIKEEFSLSDPKFLNEVAKMKE